MMIERCDGGMGHLRTMGVAVSSILAEQAGGYSTTTRLISPRQGTDRAPTRLSQTDGAPFSVNAKARTERRPMRKLQILILLLALAAGSEVRGQVTDSEIVLGGIMLQLGMSQNETLAALGPVYDLKDIDGTNWLVSGRGSSSLGDVGDVAFRDRRLVLVNKDWSPRSPSANQLVGALYDALQSVGGGDWQTCRVHSGRPHGGPATDLRVIQIVCSGHDITVSGGGDFASEVSESISITAANNVKSIGATIHLKISPDGIQFVLVAY